MGQAFCIHAGYNTCVSGRSLMAPWSPKHSPRYLASGLCHFQLSPLFLETQLILAAIALFPSPAFLSVSHTVLNSNLSTVSTHLLLPYCRPLGSIYCSSTQSEAAKYIFPASLVSNPSLLPTSSETSLCLS